MRKESHESGRRVWFAPASGRRNHCYLNGYHTCTTAVWQNEHAQSADERAGSELRKQRRQHQSEKQRHFGVSVQAGGHKKTDTNYPYQQYWANNFYLWDDGDVHERPGRLCALPYGCFWRWPAHSDRGDSVQQSDNESTASYGSLSVIDSSSLLIKPGVLTSRT
jgi:hypothetical protein